MADMAFECAWRLLAASWPDGVLMNSDPLTGGSTSELWFLHIFGGGVFVGKCYEGCSYPAASAAKLLFSLCSRSARADSHIRSRVPCDPQRVRLCDDAAMAAVFPVVLNVKISRLQKQGHLEDNNAVIKYSVFYDGPLLGPRTPP
jgi:hypothetical protein